MLHTLHIHNLALIDAAEIRFAAGLTVVSGETGCGKSLLITALALLRGEKASGQLVRHGAKELRVDGEFRIGGSERSHAVARIVGEHCDGVIEDDLLLVTRIVDRQGRTRVRIGGRPSTLSALRQLGEVLLEIHGQGDSRALMRPEIQCETLDAFAGTSKLRREFAGALRAARQLQKRSQVRAESEHERRQHLEFVRFRHQTITELDLQEDELSTLEGEHRVLSNLEGVQRQLDEALDALLDGEQNATDAFGRATRAVEQVAAVDRRLDDVAERMAEIEELVAGVCRDLQSGRARLELDPARMHEVSRRLDEIHDVLRRFGPTEADLRQSLESAARELAAAGDETDPEAMIEELRVATNTAAKVGKKLVRARLKAAPAFSGRIRDELRELGMPHTEIRVAMDDSFVVDRMLEEATDHGPMSVDIEVRINPGEPFHSMRDTASGGELARIVLAVKKTLADQDRVPLLVLDEIDAEIGGRLGLAVGRMLHEVARNHQVVIVTHLAPVAAWAHHHFLVDKHVDRAAGGDRTRSTVRLLAGKEVEKELAAMSAGDESAAALRQARSLVQKARELGEAD